MLLFCKERRAHFLSVSQGNQMDARDDVESAPRSRDSTHQNLVRFRFRKVLFDSLSYTPCEAQHTSVALVFRALRIEMDFEKKGIFNRFFDGAWVERQKDSIGLN